MGSSSKRRQTFAKVARERMIKERRERKQEKKDEKKRAAAEEITGDGRSADTAVPAGAAADETVARRTQTS